MSTAVTAPGISAQADPRGRNRGRPAKAPAQPGHDLHRQREVDGDDRHQPLVQRLGVGLIFRLHPFDQQYPDACAGPTAG